MDIGKLKDYTAFAMFERRRPALVDDRPAAVEPADMPGYGGTVVTTLRPPFSGTLTADERRARQWSYRLVRLKRWDVGTDYDDILRWLVRAYGRPVERQGLGGTVLALDYTGVGVAVCEWLRKEMSLTRAKAMLRPIWIQSGQRSVENAAGGWNVPKRELVSALQVLMGSGRLTVESRLENCGTLVKEFENFKVKINTATANESYEAWRESDHDDMVLACAVALWVGEQGQKEMWLR